jgi:hypothetical protein
MPKIYGKTQTKLDLEKRSGSLLQFAGVREYVLADGVERGVRCIEFRTGSGLRFEVMVDRAMDLGLVECNGAAIGWHSHTGFRHPSLHENNDEGGLSWLRSMSGMMLTCGLDHTLFNDSQNADHFNYPHRKTVDSFIHGRIANTPSKLTGYGEDWDGDECTLWCEGIVKQAAVGGENLELHRRIEAKVGESEIKISDRVVNAGFSRTPHMYLYHINAGYPVLDDGSEFIAPIRHTIWAAHEERLKDQGVGYRTQPAPQETFYEQVYEHAVEADAENKVPVALVNRGFNNGQGFGLLIEFDKTEFPFLFQWQHYENGGYTMGIEPSTNHVLGKPFARERDELCWLDHGESKSYSTTFRILQNQGEIDSVEHRIRGICTQAGDEYPTITGNWDS